MSSKLPVAGIFRITCEFGRKGNWKAGFHTGVDMVNDDKVIYSPTYGKVYRIGFDASYGNYVVIADDTPNDVHYHWLCHLSKTCVSKGQSVKPETIIGQMGATGNATGIHLHYEIRNKYNKYGVVDNPCDYMGVPNKVGTYDESDYQIVGYSETKILKRNTNLRSKPTTDSDILNLYISGTTVYVLEKEVDHQNGYFWDKVKIKATGEVGYMINKNYR